MAQGSSNIRVSSSLTNFSRARSCNFSKAVSRGICSTHNSQASPVSANSSRVASNLPRNSWAAMLAFALFSTTVVLSMAALPPVTSFAAPARLRVALVRHNRPGVSVNTVLRTIPRPVPFRAKRRNAHKTAAFDWNLLILFVGTCAGPLGGFERPHLLQPGYDLEHPALQRFLTFHRSYISYDLPPKRGGHALEHRLSARGLPQSDDQRRGNNRFARLFVPLDGDLQNRASVHAKFLANISVDGHAMAVIAARNQCGPNRHTFHRSSNRQVRVSRTQYFRYLSGDIYEADNPDPVDSSRKDVDAP